MKGRVLIASAGTGGHVYPALALADFLKKEGIDVFFVTSDRGESKIIVEKGYNCKELSYRGLHRRFCFENVKRVLKIGLAVFHCIKLIKYFMPDLIVGMGGYGEVPPILAGKLLGIRTLIHEQDVKPGLSTRILAPLVDRISISYEETMQFLRKDLIKKCVVTGNPVREEILKITLGATKKKWGLEGRKVLFAFGGSLGAKRVNDAIVGFLKDGGFEGSLEDWGIILVTGKENFDEVNEALRFVKSSLLMYVRVLPYIDNIWDAYGAADLVLSRAGASTVAELRVLGLPAILVPYPHSTGNHQFFNARLLEREGQAVLIKDEELTSSKLYELLKREYRIRRANRENSAQLLGKVVLNLVWKKR
ncbi:MAG: undecaprenyldiphospho-muramoylpentapeptide beta-N-acetylglucosaminyltransferase [Synergistetes bacterium]|nr:undecaprenyldiphospho-muramoylpentapeptide beta-N-acetylglucosaminyltransferase [Synergistota bacterium]MDW8192045.1 undecaprenyldiphospho-muramoylpentapeptide beta-N-acetylglucosaminyltransferase [Synergistota bacterium]